MTIKTPFHVLMLPGGITSQELQNENESRQLDHLSIQNDFLSLRYKFWKKKVAKQIDGTYKNESTEYNVCDDIIDGDDPPIISTIATPLEVALIKCCEPMPLDGAKLTSQNHFHRSRIHRPICPSNYDCIPAASSPAPNDENRHDATNIESGENTKPRKMGILLRGKESHFLALLCMYCTANALGHRALALAIIQRTVDWEAANFNQSTGQALDKIDQSREQLNLSSDIDSDAHKENDSKRLTRMERKTKEEESQERMKYFLAAGGMKLLARWLVDSFTVVPSSKGHVASPTGSLLLPILQLLRSIPFNKNVVMASQIHKCIKRLKKAMDTLVKGLNHNQLKEKHCITGGLPVGITLSALDDLMISWEKAAASDSSPHDGNRNIFECELSPFSLIQKELAIRFDALAALQNEGGTPPPWLPKTVSSIVSGKSNLLALYAKKATAPVDASTTNRIDKQLHTSKSDTYASKRKENTFHSNVLSTKKKRIIHDLMSRKTIFLSEHKPQEEKITSTKRVSWADKPSNGNSRQQLVTTHVFLVNMTHEEEDSFEHPSICINQNGGYPINQIQEKSSDNCELEDESSETEDMF